MRSYEQSLDAQLKKNKSGNVELKKRLEMAHNVFSGLDYLHERVKVIHADLAVKNIFVDSAGILVIGDFGLSNAVGQGRSFNSDTQCFYLAPEVSIPELKPRSTEGDCCSAGLVALAILINQVSYNLWGTPEAIEAKKMYDDCFIEDYLKFSSANPDKIMLPELYSTAHDLLDKHGDQEIKTHMEEAKKILTEVIFPLMKKNPTLRSTARNSKELIEKHLSTLD